MKTIKFLLLLHFLLIIPIFLKAQLTEEELATKIFDKLNILTSKLFSESEFNKMTQGVFLELRESVKTDYLDQEKVLNSLQKLIDEKIKFYDEKIKNKTNYKEFAGNLGFGLIAAGLCATFTYLIHQKMYKASYAEIEDIKKVKLRVFTTDNVCELGGDISVWGPSWAGELILSYLRRILSLRSTISTAIFLQILGSLGTCFWAFASICLIADEFFIQESRNRLVLQKKEIERSIYAM